MRRDDARRLKNIVAGSLDRIFKNWRWLVLCALIDVTFFFILFFFVRPAFFSKTADYLYAVQGMVSKFSMQYSAIDNTGFFSLILQSGSLAYLLWLAVLLLLWLGILYFLFSFFNSLNWYVMNKKIFKEKLHMVKYSERFFRLSIWWIILYGLYNLLAYLFSFGFTLAGQTEDIVSPPLLFNIIFIIGLYFVLVSYSMLLHEKRSFRKSFSIGLKNAGVLLPLYIIVMLTYAVINLLLILFGKISPLLLLISGFVLLFPFVTIARALFQAGLNEVQYRRKKG